MKFSVHVQGDHHQWSFDFEADPQFWDEWIADGLEVYQKVGEVEIGKGVSEWINELDEYNQKQVRDYFENGDEDESRRCS